ncbi:MAG: hypothetical protein M0R74_07740 [Dehalococcoidia bacterium]|nr:hypothetical protein [Dehalococcoidia bacterium]
MFAPSINVDLEQLQKATEEEPAKKEKPQARSTRRKGKGTAEQKQD